jgi:hypothetical protein
MVEERRVWRGKLNSRWPPISARFSQCLHLAALLSDFIIEYRTFFLARSLLNLRIDMQHRDSRVRPRAPAPFCDRCGLRCYTPAEVHNLTFPAASPDATRQPLAGLLGFPPSAPSSSPPVPPASPLIPMPNAPARFSLTGQRARQSMSAGWPGTRMGATSPSVLSDHITRQRSHLSHHRHGDCTALVRRCECWIYSWDGPQKAALEWTRRDQTTCGVNQY